MKIIADENLHSHFIHLLKENGFELFVIAEGLTGISDEEVVEIVKQQGGTLITEDKDFGELVFAHHIAKVTIVFLRYRKPELQKVGENLLKIIREYSEKEGEFFITITSTRIRIRQI